MKDPFEHFQLDDEDFDKSWLHRNWATLSPLRIELNDQKTANILAQQPWKNNLPFIVQS
jgi:hypothetical protein